MSIFSKIKNAVFGGDAKAAEPEKPGLMEGLAKTVADTAQTVSSAVASNVDVVAQLDAMASANSQKLNWRNSIVDLMKLVGMESSLQERKELAAELGYTGELNGSAEMNIWLHKEVMRQLAANGGQVPSELLD